MLATAAPAVFKSRVTLYLENLALRHQLSVLRRSVKRPKLTSADRLLWAWLCEFWIDWRSSLVIVKPETVIGWHRKGFRLFWTWKVRHGQPGRPPVSKEIRQLIRKMSRENPLWGAPLIHGELLKLGIDIGETSVGKYMVRSRKPPSQTWRTFLANHVKTMVSVLLHRAHDPVSGPIPVSGPGSRLKADRAFQRHRPSCGRVDRAATAGGFPL
jgi:putative transposase